MQLVITSLPFHFFSIEFTADARTMGALWCDVVNVAQIATWNADKRCELAAYNRSKDRLSLQSGIGACAKKSDLCSIIA